MHRLWIMVSMIFVFILSACSRQGELLLVTTTSLDNSGLLEFILPRFEEEYNCKVKVVAVGTGAALELGQMGEADILLVHDYDREMQFIADGYGEKRHNVMYNDFIFVGPSVLSSTTLEDTLAELMNHHFYSRGDGSGTHSRELSLWEMYGYDVSTFGDWYLETGQSMGSTLTMASLSAYYTFTDRGTFLSMKEQWDLIIVYENAEELMNQYGVIKIDPSLHNRDEQLADAFYDWILREDTQDYIATYIRYDEQLFYPNSGD